MAFAIRWAPDYSLLDHAEALIECSKSGGRCPHDGSSIEREIENEQIADDMASMTQWIFDDDDGAEGDVIWSRYPGRDRRPLNAGSVPRWESN